MSLPSSPNNRREVYLSNIAGQGTTLPTEPHTREEEYLDYIAKNGGGGGTGDGDMKKSVYDSDLAVAGAGGIADYVSGAIADKVDKVSGKGLSTNDYDDSAKTIVDGVSTALDGKVSKSNTAGLLKNDGTVDTTSYATAASVTAIKDGQSIDSFGDVESALSNKVSKSETTGLLKNDGTVDTTSYATTSALNNKVSKSSTAGLLKNDGTVDTTSYATTSALNDKVSKSSTAGLLKNDGTVDTTSYATASSVSAIKDGTSIDSFKDVEDALAMTANDNNLSPIDFQKQYVIEPGNESLDYVAISKNPGSALYDAVVPNTKLIKDTVGWSGKNKCPNDLVSYNANNTTITVNADKSVSLTTGSGGATADTWMVVHAFNPNELPAGNYKLSGCPSGGSNQKYEILFREDPAASGGVSREDFGNGASLTISDTSKTYKLFIGLKSGQTASNLTFKPMITDADILDSTYEPYFGSTAFPRSEQAVLGAKNLLPLNANNIQIPTGDSVTVEDKGLKGFKISGSKTSGHWTDVVFITDFVLKANVSYKLSCIGIPENVKGIRLSDGSSFIYSMDNGVTSVIYTPSTDISVKKVYTTIAVSDAGNIDFTYFPMITLASDNDDTYALHAQTNKQLTDAVNGITVKSFTTESITVNAGQYSPQEISIANGDLIPLGIVGYRIDGNGNTECGMWKNWMDSSTKKALFGIKNFSASATATVTVTIFVLYKG